MFVLKRCVLLFALSTVVSAAHAISLGAIEVESTLNQALRATVPLRDVEADELSGVRAALAPAARFEAAGLLRNDYLRGLRMEVGSDERGRPVVHIRGEGPLREPVLDLLVVIRQGQQSVQRGYTLLIDPPGVARDPVTQGAARPSASESEREPAPESETAPGSERETRSTAAAVRSAEPTSSQPARVSQTASPSTTAQASAEPAAQDARVDPVFFNDEPAERELDPELLAAISEGGGQNQPRRSASPTTEPAQASTPVPARSAENGVYRVRAGETLWRVAFNTRADSGIDMAQQMLAIVIANPQAFDQGDAEELLRDAELRIPDAQSVRGIDAARAETTMQSLTGGALRTGAVNPDLMPDAETTVTASTNAAGDAGQVSEQSSAQASQPASSGRPDDAATGADNEVDGAEGVGDEPAAETDGQVAGQSTADPASPQGDDDREQSDRLAAEASSGEVAGGGEAAAASVAGNDTDAVDEGAARTGTAATIDPGSSDAPAQEEEGAAQPGTGAAEATEPVAQASGGSSERAAAAGDANRSMLVALLVIAAGLVGLLLWRRRRAAEEEADAAERAFTGAPFEHDEGDEGDEGDSEAHVRTASAADTTFAHDDEADASAATVMGAGAGAVAEPADDPIADADFRIAYGMFDDATERLQEAIRQEPERADLRLKLAEVHHAAENREAFLEAADAASGCGLDDAQRSQLATMADQIAPDSRHAGAVATGVAVTAAPAEDDGDQAPVEAEAEAEVDSEPVLAEGEPDLAAEAVSDDHGLDFDLSALESDDGASPRAEPEVLAASDDNSLDFDLAQLDGEQPSDGASFDPDGADFNAESLAGGLLAGDSAEATTAGPASESVSDDNSLDFDLDSLGFDLDHTTAAGQGDSTGDGAARSNGDDASDLDLEDFSLADFDTGGETESARPEEPAGNAEGSPSGGAETVPGSSDDDDFAIGGLDLGEDNAAATGDVGNSLAGQLEMAQAYVDIGDNDLARPMLQEVAEQGTAEQQREAAKILERLG